jgi:hypothetical protein
MKKTILSLLLFIPSIGFGQFSENMGTPTSNTLISSYTGWQNNGNNTFTGTGDVRTSTASSGYTGASASGNVFLTNSGSTTLQIAGINTNTLTIPAISFGLYKSTTASNATELTFEYSTDGVNFTAILIPAQSTGTGTAAWRSILLSGLPQSTTLTIRFTNTSTTPQFRIDDIKVNSLATLPISLTSFTGKAVDKSVLLNWETASESNNEYFEVLKSSNGKSFTAIGTVKGSGTATSAKSYSLVDNNPAAGTNYYQLVQYDFDGKSSKSDVIPVNSSIANSSLTVYAAASSVNVSINSANATDGTLKIFDITGKKLNETKLSLTKGFNTLSLPLTLNSGIHVINFITSAEVINSKFIKD